MWLLNTERAELRNFNNLGEVQTEGGYAILSHMWRHNPVEQTFQDVSALRGSAIPRTRAYDKIRKCCMLAQRHGFSWVWIDTYCIDKTSSSELSEAINSMFQWYSKAAVCYAYLDDVSNRRKNPGSPFYRSKWFKRGWTLQELIAPKSLLFIMNDWTILGTRAQLVSHVSAITSIDEEVLLHRRELGTVSVARRMSWASGRETTRVEDEAYCLMGIFGVNMPTIYGEGRAAFYRLQEEIMQLSPDQTLFAWGHNYGLNRVCVWIKQYGIYPPTVEHLIQNDGFRCFLLASSPNQFKFSSQYERISLIEATKTAEHACAHLAYSRSIAFKANTASSDSADKSLRERRISAFTVTSLGMQSTLPVIRISDGNKGTVLHVAVLGCRNTRKNTVVGLALSPLSNWLQYQGDYTIYACSGSVTPYRLVEFDTPEGTSDNQTPELARAGKLNSASAQLSCENVTWSTIHILHRPLPHMHNNFESNIMKSSQLRYRFFKFTFSNWSIRELQQRGFYPTAEYHLGPSTIPDSITFSSGAGESFTIDLQICSKTSTCHDLSVQVSISTQNSKYNNTKAYKACDDCEVSHIGQEQNLVKRFGDRLRMVELISHPHRPDDLVTLEYLIDISLSGSIYLAKMINRAEEDVDEESEAEYSSSGAGEESEPNSDSQSESDSGLESEISS